MEQTPAVVGAKVEFVLVLVNQHVTRKLTRPNKLDGNIFTHGHITHTDVDASRSPYETLGLVLFSK